MKRHGYDAIDVDKYKIHEIFGIYKTEGKKLCRMFNESATIRKVPPHKDAIKYVKKLHEEEGYIFHAVTSLSNDEYAQHLRTKNLCELFGPTVFEKYVYLDTGADKDEALAVYKDTGCIWVEDKVENAQAGAAVGLESLVMKHAYNSDCTEFPLMNNWKEIYEYIKGK